MLKFHNIELKNRVNYICVMHSNLIQNNNPGSEHVDQMEE